MSGVYRSLFQCLHDDALDIVVGDRPRNAGSRLIMQAVETVDCEPAAPFGDRGGMDAENLGHLSVGGARRALKHDATTERE